MRIASIALAVTMVLVGCSADDSSGSPSTGGPTGNTTGSTGAAGSTTVATTGGVAGSTSSTSTTSATGTAGAGGSTSGTGGAGGTGGTSAVDGSAGSGSNEAGLDSGAPSVDAHRDVVYTDAPSKSRHTMRPLGTVTGSKNGYWEYLPPGYGDGTKVPLMVFWHGVGEDGDGSAAQLPIVLHQGPPKYIDLNQWPPDRPFIVLSPQHGPANCPTATEMHDFIAFAMGHYDVDLTRVYLTGLSCGAIGSASYLGQYKGEQVVASVLIAGNITAAWTGAGCSLLDQSALYVFHGDADTGQSIGPDNMYMPMFIACPQPHKDVLYKVWPGLNHQPSWEQTYETAKSAPIDIYAWMLMQHR